MIIVEGLCYLYPHKPELLANSSPMKGVWKYAEQLLKNKDSLLAPLLVDDLKREGYLTEQTIDEVLGGRKLPMLAENVIESRIEFYYGRLGCKMFDALYHKDCLSALSLLNTEWKWIVVHPIIFKEQQSGMLLGLWKNMIDGLRFGEISNKTKVRAEDIRNYARDKFLEHFEHYWIDKDGEMVEHTKPVYQSKKIIHYEIPKLLNHLSADNKNEILYTS
jgi:hypothetical protein